MTAIQFDPSIKTLNLDKSPRFRQKTEADGEGYVTKAVRETVGFFVAQVLSESDDPVDVTYKLKRQELAVEIYEAEEAGETVELDQKQADDIRTLIGKSYPGLIVAQVFQALDNPVAKANGNGQPES